MNAIVPERLDCRRRICSPTDIHSGTLVASSLVDAALLEEVPLAEESAEAGDLISLSSEKIIFYTLQ